MKFLANIVKRLPKSIILGTIMSLITFSCFSLYTLKVESDSISKIQKSVQEHNREEKESLLSIVLELGYELSEQSTEILSKRLENELLTEYDLDKLKNEFENSILSDEFYTVVKNALSIQSNTNALFNNEQITMVANSEGIMAEFNNSGKGSTLKYTSKILPWDEYISSTVNPELTTDAIKHVLEEGQGVAFIQRKGENIIQTCDINELIDIYINEDISALEPYYFLTASYITEDGDIFGTSDQTFLESNKNYKLVVLNAISVEEVMGLFEKELVKIDKRSDITSTRLDGYSDIMIMSSVIGNLILFAIAISLAGIYNKSLSKDDD